MRYLSFFLGLALLMSGCVVNRYYLDDTEQNERFLVEKISEFSQKGLTSSKPILVIDGVEFVKSNQIDLKGMKLSKADIKKIELLKKEAAVRVFGKSGERGVLLITTKNEEKN